MPTRTQTAVPADSDLTSSSRARGPLRAPGILLAAAVLCLMTATAALTTSDPLWWHLHFSRLGMFADASGVAFNAGVIACGAVTASTGVSAHVRLTRAAGRGAIGDARAVRVTPVLVATLGICLLLIGVIPLTLNEFLHERAANGVILAFGALQLVTGRFLPELPPHVRRVGAVSTVVLVLGIAGMLSGVINLALYEAMAFGAVLTWLHLLERGLSGLARTAEERPAEETRVDAVSATPTTPRGRRTLRVRRTTRFPRAAHVRPGRYAAPRPARRGSPRPAGGSPSGGVRAGARRAPAPTGIPASQPSGARDDRRSRAAWSASGGTSSGAGAIRRARKGVGGGA